VDGCGCVGGAARRAYAFSQKRAAWENQGHSQESSVTIDVGGYATPSGNGIGFGTLLFPAFGGRGSAPFLSEYDVVGLNYRDLRG
jgi:hypothetical protein